MSMNLPVIDEKALRANRYKVHILDRHHQDFSVHIKSIIRRADDDAKRLMDEYGDPIADGIWRDMEQTCCLVTQHNPGLVLEVTVTGGEERVQCFQNGRAVLVPEF